jgi:outer membrane protein assembly factor BamB
VNSPIWPANWLHAGSPQSDTRKTGGGHPRPRLSRFLAVGLSVGMVVALPASSLAAVGDWAQFRESQTHQAHNTTETLISDTNVHALGLAWTGATGAAIATSPAVANGVVYIGSNDGKLYAFAVGCATGGGTCTPIWSAQTGGAIDSSPAAAGTRVFVGSADGKVYAYAIGCATGGGTCTPVWTGQTGGAIHSSPAVDSGVLYIGSNDGKLYAFDAAGVTGCTAGTCTPLWTATTGAAIESSPAIANGFVYVGSDDSKLYVFAVGCSTGGGSCSPVWTATTGGAIHSSPTVTTGTVYVGSLDSKLYAYDATGVAGCSAGSCSPLWTGQTGGAIYSSPSIGDGHVWVGSDDGKVYSWRTSCGTGGFVCPALWTGDTGHPIRSSPATAHDVLYIGSSDGKLYAFDADCSTVGAACTPAFSATIGTSIVSSPAISNSVVYIGSSDGKLYAFHLVIDHLVLTPANPTVVSGANQAFTAEAFDPANVDLGDFTAVSTFAISAGATCTGNLCGSTTSGTYTVTATYGTVTATTSLIVSTSGATYYPLNPTRLLDTRIGNGLSGPFTSQVPRTFQVAGRGGVPGNALAVTGNLTVTDQTARGWLFIGPSAAPVPGSSTLNFPVGDVRANAVTVALALNGTLGITYVASGFPTATAHVVFDVTGFFMADAGGASFFPLTPARLLDTRVANGLSGPFVSQHFRTFAVAGRGGVDAHAVAVTGNLTVTDQQAKGWLFIGPVGSNSPTSSTLNFPVDDVRANAVTVALASDGSLSVTYFASTSTTATAHVVFDVTGYFLPGTSGATYVALPPTRLLDTRSGNGLSGVFHSQQFRSFAVAGRGGAPASAVAVTGNLTVVDMTSHGFLYMGPNQTNNPTSSTLNFPDSDIRANAVTVALAGDGSLSVTYYNTSVGPTTDVVFDLTGFFVH